MATTPPADSEPTARRVVLIDFDWQDADLMPELLRRPGIAVRLVAGEREDDAGVRVAELCGVRRTVELADLTREIFDLALVSERSVRRPQLERLLGALGTPVTSPQSFLGTSELVAAVTTGTPATFTNGGEDYDALGRLLAQALPDLSDPEPDRTLTRNGTSTAAGRQGALPEPEDRDGLGRVLERWAAETGATAAALHAGTGEQVPRVCALGPEDALLETLVRLALDSDAAQVVVNLGGSPTGRAWGAWPFRTRTRRAVLAAAHIDPVEGRAAWERSAQELRVAWEGLERPRPPADRSPVRHGWLDVEEFRARIERAIGHNHADGVRWALHRLRFGGPVESAEALCRTLPGQMRETDDICHPAPRDVLLLTDATTSAFGHIRRRLATAWEHAWRDARQPAPAPPISDERIDLLGPEDAEAFRLTAGAWLAGH